MLTRLLLFTLIIAMPFLTCAQVDLTKGLVAYYPFNGNANDASGNGNNPSFNNATLTSDYYGKANSAYHFNGVDNYIQIPNSNSLNPGNQISLCAWVKPTGFYTGKCYNNIIIAKENVDYQTGNFSLRYTDVINGCTDHPDTANEHFVGNDEVSNVDSAAIQLNKWYSVVYTSDGVRSKLYINCELVADMPVSNKSYSNAYDLFLGHLDNTTYPYWLNGDLDEVRIYNRPLNAAEVSAYSAVCNKTETKVIAGFTSVDSVCAGTPVKFTNTSVGASNYYWSFCSSIKSTPTATNIGNPGNQLERPVFGDFGLDDNGNYYEIITNHVPGKITRLNFGSSLLNNPTAEDLGNLNGLVPNQLEGIQVEKVNGKWYAIAVGGGNQLDNSSPRIIKLDFGNSLSNTPTITNWGNIGNLNLPIDFQILQEGGNYYGFTMNVFSNTITRFDIGSDFTNPPSSVNLGTIGNLSYPDGFSFINFKGTWYCFAVSNYTNGITRLDFGNSLTNIPTATEISNPNNLLDEPRDIAILTTCDGIFGYVVNTNRDDIVKLDFGATPTSTPTATSLGNIGGFDFPHSFSRFFSANNSIYSFVINDFGNNITRLKFTGCQDIPASTKQNPDPVTFDSAGIYTVNLLVDIGLPTQTSYCKQIIVKDCTNPCDSFKVNAGKDTSICYGASVKLSATGATTYNWNATPVLSDTTIANPVARPLTTTQFIVTGSNALGCSDTDTVKVTVLSLPVFSINNDTSICNGSKVNLLATGNGTYHYHWEPATYLSDTSIANPVTSPTDTIAYLVTATDSNKCISKDTVQINVVPVPVVSTINNASICLKDSVVLTTTATNATKFVWSPSTGLNNNSTQSPKAYPAVSTTYTVTASNSLCTSKDSVHISVLPLPTVFAGNDTTTCDVGTAQLHASGAVSYSWLPTINLSNPNNANTVASPAVTTIFYVTGIGANSCHNKDSVTVFKEPDPVFSVVPTDSSICSGQKITLIAAGGDTYNWSPSQTLSSSTSATTVASPFSVTKYSVVIYDSTCKVSSTLSSTISINASPTVTIKKSNDVDCSNLQAQLTATGGVTYSWLPATAITNTQIPNPIVNPTSDTWYSVAVTNTNGCITQDSILVKSTLGDQGMYVANAFTPNGDGRNDCFGVHYWGQATSFDMKIFDRWGMMVYHSQNVGECWDGSYKGKKQGSGTFVYMIKSASACGKQDIFRKGTVVLIR